MNYIARKLSAALTAAVLGGTGVATPALSDTQTPSPLLGYQKSEKSRARIIETLIRDIRGSANNVGFALNMIQNAQVPQVRDAAKLLLKESTKDLQKNLQHYTAMFSDVMYFRTIQQDGVLGKDTAALLAQVSAHAGLREFLIHVATPQNPTREVDTRFLRNELQERAPQEFIAALETLAQDLNVERAAEEGAKNNAISMAFGECVLRLNDENFSPQLLAEEYGKVKKDPAYVSIIVPDDCAPYLNGLPGEFRQSAQTDALEGVAEAIKPADEDEQFDKREVEKWCDRYTMSQIGPEVKCFQFKL